MAWNLGAIVVNIVASTKGWTAGYRRVSSDVKMLGTQVGALTAMLSGFAVATVREFGKFDRAIREATAVSTVSEEQFKQMSRMA